MERLVAQLHIDGAKARQPGLEAESARLGGRRYRAFIIFYIIGQLIPFENYFVTLFVEAPSTHDKYRETDIDFQTVFVFKTGTALTKKNDNVQTRNMMLTVALFLGLARRSRVLLGQYKSMNGCNR